MTLPVVVDASAGVEIALRTTDGQRLVAHVRGRMPHVPDVFYVEAAAALRRMENRGLFAATAAGTLCTTCTGGGRESPRPGSCCSPPGRCVTT